MTTTYWIVKHKEDNGFYKKVALIETLSKNPSVIWENTQNIESAWVEDNPCVVMTNGELNRSSMVGDIFMNISDNIQYMVCSIGFQEL